MHPGSLTPTIDTIVGYLHRRRRSAIALTAGEAATIAVSVVRGCAAHPSRAAGAQWRLTAAGRPVLVEDPGSDDVLAASIAVLTDLVPLVPPDVRPGFARLRDALLTEPPPEWESFERRLLGIIEPHPLVLGPLAPVEPDAAPTAAAPTAESPFFAATRRLWSAAGRRRPRVVVAGSGVAVLVTVVTMAVTAPGSVPAAMVSASAAPGESGSPSTSATPYDASSRGVAADASADQESPSPAPDSTGGSSAAPSPVGQEPNGATGDALRSAVVGILSSLSACADETCAAPLRDDAASAGEPRPLDPAHARLDVVDDFGGLAVVRLVAGERTQYITVVRADDRWLVRSVRDVADQPS